MTAASTHPTRNKATLSASPAWFAAVFGCLLGLAMLKFGNPAIMEKWVEPPGDIYEFIFNAPWPINWAYALLGGCVLLALPALRRAVSSPPWLVWLPLAWCVWELAASTSTTNAYLTNLTIRHFVAATLCFYLGWFTLGRAKQPGVFWFGVTICFTLVLAVGWSQHFGGLEATRKYFELYILPKAKDVPPEYLKKMASNRIFGTLFYPNTLAGIILLLLPPIVAVLWSLSAWFTRAARGFLIGCLGVGALACLYWSGSKGGWILMLMEAMVALLRLPISRRLKIGVVALLLLGGLTGFAVKYHAFFQKGATSVVARFDYWRAAAVIARAHPWTGTGPGTFGPAYQTVRNPESEPARLAHNDYLQQLSDSGVFGFLTYTGFVALCLTASYPRAGTQSARTKESAPARLLPRMANGESFYRFGIWLGLLGWFTQGLFEFSLYVPGSAWMAFALLGSILPRRFPEPKDVDKT
jgi:hypothetical protein